MSEVVQSKADHINGFFKVRRGLGRSAGEHE